MKQLTINLSLLVLLSVGIATTINACHNASQPPPVVVAPSASPSASPVTTPSPVVEGVWCKADLVDFSPCNPNPASLIGQKCSPVGKQAPGCGGGAECKASCN